MALKVLCLFNLVSECDILCLQELMLTKQECHILNNCHDYYVGYGVSLVDSSDGIISGRPYGGVDFLWKRSLDQYITILDDCYDWLCGIRKCSGNKEYYLLNVYLPYESEEKRDRFNDYMAKTAIYVDTINSTCVTIIGDFNGDISKKSVFGNIYKFLDFCNEYSLSIYDKDNLMIDTYMYVSSAWGTISWLDHVICTSDANDCITNTSVLYGCINSDHHPVSFSINSDIALECVNGSINNDKIKQVIHWDTLHPSDIDVYRVG